MECFFKLILKFSTISTRASVRLDHYFHRLNRGQNWIEKEEDPRFLVAGPLQ